MICARGRRRPLRSRRRTDVLGFLLAAALVLSAPAYADSADPIATLAAVDWRLTEERESDGFVWLLYEQEKPTAGRPAFRVEADFEVTPAQAVAVLMDAMADETPMTSGEHRRLLERSPNGALVHTLIELPLLFSDRELAIRLEHRVEPETGVHRVEWQDDNQVLPPPDRGVLRLASDGFWEFRPMTPTGTHAVYVSRAEVGGSLPQVMTHRLMRGQAVDAVFRLRRLLAERSSGDDGAASSMPRQERGNP
jgi:hypothetical protein